MTRVSVSLSCATTPTLPGFLNLNGTKNAQQKLVKFYLTFLLNLKIYFFWIKYFSNFYSCDSSCSQQFILSNQSLSRTCRYCSFIKVRTKILKPFQEKYNTTGNDFKPTHILVSEKSAFSFKNELQLFKSARNSRRQSPQLDSSAKKKTKLRFTIKPEGYAWSRFKNL